LTAKRDFGRLHSEVQELLADLWQLPRVAGLRHGFRPPTDCFRTEDPPQVVIVVDVAGVDPDGLRVIVAERDVLVSGLRNRPGRGSRPSYDQMEIDYGPFERHVPLADGIDVERASATYEHGLLTVVLPVATRPVRRGEGTIAVTRR
jgi:HSP20 family molecular chaperone IbpA